MASSITGIASWWDLNWDSDLSLATYHEKDIMNMAFTFFRSKNTVLGYLSPQRTANKARDLFLTPRSFPLKPWEQVKESEGRRLALNDGLSAISWGEGTRQVLLVHGWESRSTQLAGFVDALCEQGFKVVAMDAPAHGKSLGKQANPVMFARAIQSVNQQLGPFDAIIGHSMGGSAVAIALSEGVNCATAVLISAPSSIEGVLQRFGRFIGLPAFTVQKFIQRVENSVGRPVRSLEVSHRVRTLTTQALVIHDETDEEVPFADAQKIAENWHGATLVATRGYGHRAIVRQPEVWQQVARFVGQGG